MNRDWPIGYGYYDMDFEEPNVLELLMTKHSISVSTVSAITGASQLAVWKWERKIRVIPAPHERTLKRFLQHLEKR